MRTIRASLSVFAVFIFVISALASSAANAQNTPTTTPSTPPVTILHPALFLVGDSIMNPGSRPGAKGPVGFGTDLIPMFDPAKIHVYNDGRGGRSSRGYIEEGLWAKVLDQMQAGDWVIIMFGHNDHANSANYPDRISAPGSGDDLAEVESPAGQKKQVHTYGWYLKQYASDTKAKGATLIILSPVPRNQWTDDGKIKRGFDGYVQWAADAAKASDTLYIDLNTLVADRLDQLGQETAKKCFFDTQHTSEAGAKINAESIAQGLRQLKNCPLADDLLPAAAAAN